MSSCKTKLDASNRFMQNFILCGFYGFETNQSYQRSSSSMIIQVASFNFAGCMKHEIIKSRAPYRTSSYAWPPCRSYLHCPLVCEISSFSLTMVEFNELLALRWSMRIADCQNFETPPCRYQDQKYTNFREATRTSGNRFHLLPAQIIFSNRTHLLQIILLWRPRLNRALIIHAHAHDQV